MAFWLLWAVLSAEAALTREECEANGRAYENSIAWATSFGVVHKHFEYPDLVSEEVSIRGDGKKVMHIIFRQYDSFTLFDKVLEKLDNKILVPSADIEIHCFVKGSDKSMLIILSDKYEEKSSNSVFEQPLNERLEFYLKFLEYSEKLIAVGFYFSNPHINYFYTKKGSLEHFFTPYLSRLYEINKENEHLSKYRDFSAIEEINQAEKKIYRKLRQVDKSFELKEGVYKEFISYLEEGIKGQRSHTFDVAKAQIGKLQNFLAGKKRSEVEASIDAGVIDGALSIRSRASQSPSSRKTSTATTKMRLGSRSRSRSKSPSQGRNEQLKPR